MLRRFETYGFAPHATADDIEELARVLRRAGLYIPEVLDSAVGRNRSGVGVDLVWEHAYADPEAYARYMRHPYHICVLDRYLLPEAPECITASRRELALGLLGYEVDGAPFRRSHGIRRVVAMKAAPDASPEHLEAFLGRCNMRATSVPELRVSIAAPNRMGLEWFPDGWTHLWEQAYDDEAAMTVAAAGESEFLASGPIVEWVELWYVIETDASGAPTGDRAAGVAGASGGPPR
jgi:hypothetical protein